MSRMPAGIGRMANAPWPCIGEARISNGSARASRMGGRYPPRPPDRLTPPRVYLPLMTPRTASPDGSSPAAGFSGLGLDTRVVEALATLGYEEPTPVQREAIPPL